MCLRVGNPDDVQEEYKRFILIRAEECPTSSGWGESCIISHRSACSRGYKQVREGGTPRSQDVSGECVFAFDVLNGLWILPSVCFSSSFSLEWSLPSPFIDARGTQGYMHVLCDIFPGKEDPRPSLSPCSWWRATVGGVTPVLWCCRRRALTYVVLWMSQLQRVGSWLSPWRRACPSGLTCVEGRCLGGVNHDVISLRSRELWSRATFRTPRRPGSCV
jgi:hypothetical protein